jgi:aspartate carbamoyltransferase catalytic subunit
MGADVTVVAPSTLVPLGIERLGVTVSSNLDEVIPQVDIIYLLRLQLERQKESFFPTLREYSNLFGLTAERMKRARDGVLVMHPGPLNRGIEISSEVADKAEAIITEQVSSGIAVRMAVLFLLFGGVSESA